MPLLQLQHPPLSSSTLTITPAKGLLHITSHCCSRSRPHLCLPLLRRNISRPPAGAQAAARGLASGLRELTPVIIPDREAVGRRFRRLRRHHHHQHQRLRRHSKVGPVAARGGALTTRGIPSTALGRTFTWRIVLPRPGGTRGRILC